MAANEGWYSAWFSGGWFPSVWFAPADESAIPAPDIRPDFATGLGATLVAKKPRRPGRMIWPYNDTPDTPENQTQDDDEVLLLVL